MAFVDMQVATSVNDTVFQNGKFEIKSDSMVFIKTGNRGDMVFPQ